MGDKGGESRDLARFLLLSHVENVFSREEILDPEIAVTFVAGSHFLERGRGWDGLHPAGGCGVDMIPLVRAKGWEIFGGDNCVGNGVLYITRCHCEL